MHARDYMPAPGEGGRPLSHDAETIEAALWELTVAGGSATRAAVAMREHHGVEVARERIRDWARGRFRARYDEIRESKAHILEQQAASAAMDFVAQAGEAQTRALKRTLAGLDQADGVGASVILRNISQARAQNLDQAAAVRGRHLAPPAINLELTIEGLRTLGLADVVEGSAEDTTDPLLLPASAGELAAP